MQRVAPKQIDIAVAVSDMELQRFAGVKGVPDPEPDEDGVAQARCGPLLEARRPAVGRRANLGIRRALRVQIEAHPICRDGLESRAVAAARDQLLLERVDVVRRADDLLGDLLEPDDLVPASAGDRRQPVG